MHQKQRISPSSPSLSLSLSVSPSPLLSLSYLCRTDVSVDKSRYKFTQNGATATNKTLATAVKNMFHDKGFKYPAFSFFFFGFIFNFDICRYLFIKIDKRVSTIPQLVPTFLRFSMYQAYNRPVLNTCIPSPPPSPLPSQPHELPTFSLLLIYFQIAFISGDITTTSSIPQNAEFGISYPLPDASDIDCCMFISNRIAFRNILAPGFQKSMNWSAYIVSFSASLPLSLSLSFTALMQDEVEASGETDFDKILFNLNSSLSVPFPSVSGVSVPNNTITVPMGCVFYIPGVMTQIISPNALVIANQKGKYL